MNKTQSAVLWPGQTQLSIESVGLENPRDEEVLVKIVASGICHTDMVMRDGGTPTPQPVVLGHEGAGIVEKTGRGVDNLKPGDRVILSFASCGQCQSCSRGEPAYCYQFFPLNFCGARADGSTGIVCNGRPIHSHIFGQSSFSTRALCHQRNVVKVGNDIPLEILAPFGCGFQTGAGAVLNSLQVKPGRSVMVFGAGAVGMCAIMAAAIAGASEIIAVDMNNGRLELALDIGATHAVNTEAAELDASVRAICGAGVDYIIDTTGHMPLVHQGVGLLAPRGSLGLVAAYRPDDRMTFDVMPLMSTGLTIRGIVEGDTDIQAFIPRLIEYYRDGLFPVDKLIRHFDFADINTAMALSESGEVIKAVVLMAEAEGQVDGGF